MNCGVSGSLQASVIGSETSSPLGPAPFRTWETRVEGLSRQRKWIPIPPAGCRIPSSKVFLFARAGGGLNSRPSPPPRTDPPVDCPRPLLTACPPVRNKGGTGTGTDTHTTEHKKDSGNATGFSGAFLANYPRPPTPGLHRAEATIIARDLTKYGPWVLPE